MIKLNAKVEKLILSELLNIIRQCDRLEHIQLQSTYLSISHVITLLKAILDARKDKGKTKVDLHFEWDDIQYYTYKEELLWDAKKFEKEFLSVQKNETTCAIQLDLRNRFRRCTRDEKNAFDKHVDYLTGEDSNISLIVEDAKFAWNYRK